MNVKQLLQKYNLTKLGGNSADLARDIRAQVWEAVKTWWIRFACTKHMQNRDVWTSSPVNYLIWSIFYMTACLFCKSISFWIFERFLNDFWTNGVRAKFCKWYVWVAWWVWVKKLQKFSSWFVSNKINRRLDKNEWATKLCMQNCLVMHRYGWISQRSCTFYSVAHQWMSGRSVL